MISEDGQKASRRDIRLDYNLEKEDLKQWGLRNF
jgi:hypothetical protein